MLYTATPQKEKERLSNQTRSTIFRRPEVGVGQDSIAKSAMRASATHPASEEKFVTTAPEARCQTPNTKGKRIRKAHSANHRPHAAYSAPAIDGAGGRRQRSETRQYLRHGQRHDPSRFGL